MKVENDADQQHFHCQKQKHIHGTLYSNGALLLGVLLSIPVWGYVWWRNWQSDLFIFSVLWTLTWIHEVLKYRAITNWIWYSFCLVGIVVILIRYFTG